MRYISNDGMVFNTEQECCEYEKKIEQERIKKEELNSKRQKRYDNIRKYHKMLMDEIHSFEKDYSSQVFSEYYYDGLARFISELGKLLS